MKKITGLFGDSLTGLVNSGLSLIKDKTKDKDQSFIHEKIKDGISVSSKRVLNLGGSAAIIGIAIINIQSNGITKENLILTGIGVVYSVGMSFLTSWSEKKGN